VLTHNDSERFESRFVSVAIESDTPALMLKGMSGSNIGVWVAHGEGKFKFADESVYREVNNCVAIRYTDDNGQPTTR